MRAEAAVPDADPELRAQPRRHQGMMRPLHGEGGHGEAGAFARLGPRSQHAHAVDGPQPFVEPRRQSGFVRRNGVPPDPLELVHGRPEGHRAHDVGRAGLLALGWIGPDHLVEVDEVDGTAAGQEGIALFEDPPRPNEGTGAERARRACGR